jgi:hypothetical protein
MELKDFLCGVHREIRDRMAVRAAAPDTVAKFDELVFTEIFAGHMAERG